ncbi:MAG TPA: class I SAM-dependent methyltransferase [Streptosporangiaceae bacterium]|nr:class I SAM-dependent methyltransferase [Streptosporangiaceae bacterium]
MQPTQPGAPQFRRDLYAGTARDYERYRVPYPPELTRDLAAESGADGRGRLLDLACGPGPLSFALRRYFAEVWAVDQEPDMIAAVRQKAGPAGDGIRAVQAAAEDLAAPAGAFDLVVIGNAFHRLPRAAVAARVLGWLRPGGLLGLAWGGSPFDPGPAGPVPWQQALTAVMDRWQAAVGERVPAGFAQDQREHPDQAILTAAGFAAAGRREYPVVREWTAAGMAGFLFSTAVLSRAALGGRAAELEADLRRELRAAAGDGPYRQDLTFACDLYRRPA